MLVGDEAEGEVENGLRCRVVDDSKSGNPHLAHQLACHGAAQEHHDPAL